MENEQPTRASVKVTNGNQKAASEAQKENDSSLVQGGRRDENKIDSVTLKDKISNTWGMIRYGGKEGRCK